MKFTLTFDGPLPPSANSSKKRREEIWAIREQIHRQLADLWQHHPSLKIVNAHRYVPKTELFWNQERHHWNEVSPIPYPATAGHESFDICDSIIVDGIYFQPLVRDSLALVCSLDILFLRAGPKGNVYQGGDLDNRIKTLLDALRVPSGQEVAATKLESKPGNIFYCLLEDDKYVTGLNVKTAQLLNKPDAKESEVRLIIDVDVRVTHPRSYNQVFLGD